ncbi:bifunctional DNA-formamidopyrimidine glycosylase/DNA-(apurinic or apyrimidinic site) lyase [Candidatus Saccharibacteria bacterium]|nr:bifunctional DNA-formamidopyrimidine glycosylase/DNA-(apurinic or apyrimidinic site) lyase [Candidatus Saccharibacteria bacterium]
MPELPEVETVRRGLRGFIVGKSVVKITTLSAKSFVGDDEKVLGRRVIRLGRRGKALIVKLDGGWNLMVHLRMTGQLVYVGNKRFAAGHPTDDFFLEMPGKHTRVIFEFEDDSRLYFNDQRKFGFVKVMDDAGLEKDAFLMKLGPEPWDMESREFFERLGRRKKTSIKAAILDQSVIAGVGNIYADEGLWRAGIFPGRLVKGVTESEVKELLKGVCEVMDKSIESGGSSMKNYVRADGTKGNYLEKFAKVFGREGEKCERCGGIIKKIRVAGRGTHYCPRCQK